MSAIQCKGFMNTFDVYAMSIRCPYAVHQTECLVAFFRSPSMEGACCLKIRQNVILIHYQQYHDDDSRALSKLSLGLGPMTRHARAVYIIVSVHLDRRSTRVRVLYKRCDIVPVRPSSCHSTPAASAATAGTTCS